YNIVVVWNIRIVQAPVRFRLGPPIKNRIEYGFLFLAARRREGEASKRLCRLEGGSANDSALPSLLVST
ncbi:MAG TPA: hypothetical protein VEA59_00260, partial [Patescibacteria group bacterium]|nr:hypothetical protein [Patescibacteria group bacterium]